MNLFYACPLRKLFKCFCLAAVWEGDPAGEQHGLGFCIPGAVFVVTYQGKSPAGELYPDLMASAGVEPDAYQTGFTSG